MRMAEICDSLRESIAERGLDERSGVVGLSSEVGPVTGFVEVASGCGFPAR